MFWEYENSIESDVAIYDSSEAQAYTYKDLKEYEKAIESFKQSLKVNIALTEAHYRIAQIQMLQKNRDSALDSIESAIKSAPSNLMYQEFRNKNFGS